MYKNKIALSMTIAIFIFLTHISVLRAVDWKSFPEVTIYLQNRFPGSSLDSSTPGIFHLQSPWSQGALYHYNGIDIYMVPGMNGDDLGLMYRGTNKMDIFFRPMVESTRFGQYAYTPELIIDTIHHEYSHHRMATFGKSEFGRGASIFQDLDSRTRDLLDESFAMGHERLRAHPKFQKFDFVDARKNIHKFRHQAVRAGLESTEGRKAQAALLSQLRANQRELTRMGYAVGGNAEAKAAAKFLLRRGRLR